MSKGNNSNKLLSSGIVLAFTSSLCCIAPLLAIFGSVGSFVSIFSWVEPIRPYLLLATALVLARAFYLAYKPVSKDNCGCEEKKTGLQSKTFLCIIAVVSVALSTFPYYATYFQKEAVQLSASDRSYNKLSVINIQGMSCAACEGHVNHALQSKKGVLSVETFYAKGQTVVKFDSTQISLDQLKMTVEKETGYKTLNK